MPLDDEWLTLGHDVEADYVAAVVAALEPSRVPRAVTLTVAYTRCTAWAPETTRRCSPPPGWPSRTGPEQDRPDPAFPTVAFPNPEEPGATDLLAPLAAQVHADVAIAEDPDADRCAVVCGGGSSPATRSGRCSPTGCCAAGCAGTYASSLVSGSLMHVIAGARGPAVGGDADRVQVDHPGRARPRPLVFGYEEALGYAVTPSVARDKDGISAALAVALLAAELKADGPHAAGPARRAGREHGLFVTGQLSVRVEDLTMISRRDGAAAVRAAVAAAGPGRRLSPTWPWRTRRWTRCGCSATASG